jgi:long-chain acyl-CoA synthetase
VHYSLYGNIVFSNYFEDDLEQYYYRSNIPVDQSKYLHYILYWYRFFWIKSFGREKNFNKEIHFIRWKKNPMNFTDYLFENRKFSKNPFLLGSDSVITYNDLYSRVNTLAHSIYRFTGSGNKILLFSENSYFFVVAYLAIIKSGNIAVLIETRIGDNELDYISKSCNFAAIFIQEKFLPRIDQKQHMVFLETTIASFPEEKCEFKNEQDAEDTAVIIFTSGSTGTKKGVMLTHRNLIANTESILKCILIKQSDRMCVVLPFFYCYGASLLHTHLRSGASLVFSNMVFLGSVINDINRFECTGFAGVPSTFQILINKTSFLHEKLPSLRYFTQAGGQLPNKYIQKIVEAFPSKDFYVMYGATEATARLSYLNPCLVTKKIGSIGKGIPGVKLEVVGLDGNLTSPHEIGEITAIGENIMKGYYNDTEETALVIKNGRYYTGDLAMIDEEGYIFIVGRSKNIIKSGGFRISPFEIEDLILSVPEVLGCVVIGIPDDLMGEAVVAVIQVLPNSDKEKIENEISILCTTSLPSYKVPRYIEHIEEYPLNSSLKIDRNALRSNILERMKNLK